MAWFHDSLLEAEELVKQEKWEETLKILEEHDLIARDVEDKSAKSKNCINLGLYHLGDIIEHYRIRLHAAITDVRGAVNSIKKGNKFASNVDPQRVIDDIIRARRAIALVEGYMQVLIKEGKFLEKKGKLLK